MSFVDWIPRALSLRTSLKLLLAVAFVILLGTVFALRSYDLTVMRARSDGIRMEQGRLVVSISSFPGRLDTINLTLTSLLLNQSRLPDLVYLLIPERIERVNVESLKVPPFVDDLVKFYNGKLSVVRPKIDYGPATKLIGALDIEKDPETTIIVADDDTIYHPETIKTLEAAIDVHPNTAPCFICEKWPLWKIYGGPLRQDAEGECAGWANAFAGNAFKVKYFDLKSLKDYSKAPKGCKLHDDVWISGQLYLRGVRPFKLSPGFDSVKQHFRHHNLSINSVPNCQSYQIPCIQYFSYFWSIF